MKKNSIFKVSFLVIVSSLLITVNISCVHSVSTPDGEINGYGYVDLGLPSGTLWATMNVGANSHEDYGNLFAWGEIESKSFYSWSTYEHYIGSNKSPRDHRVESYDLVNLGNDITGTQYDVAHVQWGDKWKMPTKAQIEELMDSTLCTWLWNFKRGIEGYEVISNLNGKSIFLPAAGLKDGNENETEGYSGYYQSSNVTEETRTCNYFITFTSNYYEIGGSSLYNGRSVRPVIDAIASTPSEVTSGYVIYNDCSTATIFNCQIKKEWSSVKEYGVCWNTKGNPTINDMHSVAGKQGIASFNATLIDLQEGITYYIRSYATNDAGMAYGKEIIYTHHNPYMERNNKKDGHDYVDLNLPSGTKWATMNVGTTRPEGYGDYYSWGETKVKDYYWWSSYKHFIDKNNNNFPFNKKYEIEYEELIDIGVDISATEYDVANVLWGTSWSMPTKAQMDELINSDYCMWTWTSLNGVKGYNVMSKLNGECIFLPATGDYSGDKIYYRDIEAHYWLSSLDTKDPHSAYELLFYNKEFRTTCNSEDVGFEYGGRCNGKTIRPVTK